VSAGASLRAKEPMSGALPPEPATAATSPLVSSGRASGLGAWLARFFAARSRAPARRAVRLRLAAGLALGSSPSLAQIEDLVRRDGLRSLVNLNTEGEVGEVLSPNVEASWAHALDLRHERASFSAELPRSGDVDRFLRVLAAVPRPTLVHSLHGRRAAAMILVHLGLERGLTGVGAVRAAADLGVSVTLDSLRAFAEAEIDRRGSGPTPAAASRD
jgi:protein tyrosine phosphatase (PTP) superfamily phosphohydrolase (DUF442 family)